MAETLRVHVSSQDSGTNSKYWEVSCLSEDDRMIVNGETKAMMSHAERVKATPRDTSVDQEWSVVPSLHMVDKYVQAVTIAYMVPKVILFVLPVFFVVSPLCALAKVYVSFLPMPTDYVPRNTCSFSVFTLFGHLLLALAAPVVAASLIMDYLVYYLFSVPVCLLTCNLCRFRSSCAVIAPYKAGPFLRSTDVLVTLLGQSYRHGVLEMWFSVSLMILFVPWMKYFIQANPWLYPLEERFVQQISTSNDDMQVDEITKAAKRIISRTKQDSDLSARVDKWHFVPHYPYPPPGRRWAVGMQKGGCISSTLLVHTTHASAEVRGSREQFVLSNSAEEPIWRVMLWYSNPYHFLTGFVEASISNGQSSQTNKRFGGEHPMWIVSSRSPMLSARTHWFRLSVGPGQVDKLFDEWLPAIAYEIRLLVLGKEAADRRYQGVISKDGISRPDPRMGVEKYDMTKVQAFSGMPRAIDV
eukprot:TRINITY_DN8321_c0_g1_i1.p1 TRINITY_DN8321_c0_g1~~TRINITY_DN8321_c0_g1_i1.p1  ORF type:complete len:470 (+),score=58.29 TRINITY_DN8321_c0_g1_i1:67-1476(+)